MWRISDELAQSAKRVKINIRSSADTHAKVLATLRVGKSMQMEEVLRDETKGQRWMRVTLEEDPAGYEYGYCMLEDRGRMLLEKVADVEGLTTNPKTSSGVAEAESEGFSHVVFASTSAQSSPTSASSDDFTYWHNVVTPLKESEGKQGEEEAILPRSDCDNDGGPRSSPFLTAVAVFNGHLVRFIVFLLLIFALAVSVNLVVFTIWDLGYSNSVDNLILAH